MRSLLLPLSRLVSLTVFFIRWLQEKPSVVPKDKERSGCRYREKNQFKAVLSLRVRVHGRDVLSCHGSVMVRHDVEFKEYQKGRN
jgi:hypothetical protein